MNCIYLFLSDELSTICLPAQLLYNNLSESELLKKLYIVYVINK